MNCSFCGTAFQVGVAYCPSCGALTPYAAPSQGVPQYNPTSSMPQHPAQQTQTIRPQGLLTSNMGEYQQYPPNPQSQNPHPQSGFLYKNQQTGQQPIQPIGTYQQNPQNQPSYSQSGFGHKNPQIRQQPVQGSGTQNMFPPVQQSSKLQTGQATNRYNPPSPSSSKLSDYKPTSTPQQAGSPSNMRVSTSTSQSTVSYNAKPTTNTNSSLKLSQYGQNPTQPGKLSDYKPATTQPGKLSDYKPASVSRPKSLANYKAFSSLPTATPGSFSSLPSLPTATPSPFSVRTDNSSTPNTSYSVVNPTAMQNPFSISSTFVPPNAMAYNPPSQVIPPITPTPKKAGGLLFGTIAVVLVIICIGAASIFLFPATNNTSNSMARATRIVTASVPTIAPIQGPSGNMSVPAVSALFGTPQMTAGVDDNNKPKQLTSTFSSGQTIYVSFTLNSKDQKGYVEAKWYKGKELFKEIDFPHDPNNTNGYFSIVYDTPTTDGSVELYWSTTSNSYNAKLAQVAHFTVTAAN